MTTPPYSLLWQMCMVISTNMGRVYRPKDCERLVLYLKDLNLPKPDKWGTCQLITFVQQVSTPLVVTCICVTGGDACSDVYLCHRW